jgi:hypothetical protein
MAGAPHPTPRKNSKPTTANRPIPMIDRFAAQGASVVRSMVADDSDRASA